MTTAWQDFKRTIMILRYRMIPYFAGILLMTVSSASINVVGAWVQKTIIDSAMRMDFKLLKTAILIGVVGMLLRVVSAPVFQYMYNKHAKISTKVVREMIMDKTGKLPMSYYENTHTGELSSRLFYDSNRMTDIYGSKLRRFVAPIISSTCYVIPMLILDYRITLVMIFVNLITLFVNIKFAKPIKKFSKSLSLANANMTEKLFNILSGMATSKAFGLDELIKTKFIDANEDFTKKSKKRLRLSALLAASNSCFNVINTFAFLAFGLFMVKSGVTSMGTLVALVTLQSSFTWNFLQIGRYLPELFDCLASARRIFEFLDLPEEETRFKMPTISSRGYIEFKDVTFSYNDEREILKDFNLVVEEGKTIALIGQSGAGKSTIAKLLLGFYPIEKGSISIDGKTFGDRDIKETRDLIAYVPQEPYIYNETIMQNIRYGRLDATDDEIIEASKAANAHDFVLEQPQGYETLVGERGSRLSGGQRQRIAIARAILRNAPVLLLDEASSALDNESEQLVNDAINKLMVNRTTILIAHRPSTIERADMVVDVCSALGK